MRLRLVLAMLVLSTILMVPSARAQTDLAAARARVDAATEQLELYLADLEATQRRGNELAGEYWQVQSGLERTDRDIEQTSRASAELDEQRTALIGEVRVVALDRYVNRNLGVVWPDVETLADREAAEALAELVVGGDTDAIDQLAALDDEQERTLARLTEQRAEQAAALVEVERTQAELSDELARLTTIRDALDAELGELEQALAELEAAEAQRQAAADEQARIDEARRRAEAAAQAAAAVTPRIPPDPVAAPTATPVPNPQPSRPLGDPVTPVPVDPSSTAVPNPQPSEPFPTATAVPSPQPVAPVAPVVSEGGMVCPLAGPFTHTDDFNSPRAVGGVHRANDLISPAGTPVLAVVSGTVEHRNSSVGGLSAHLRADNGDYYFYTHLSGYENEGAGHVAAGTVVGYVGMTGNAPIPHLHFEIHRGGRGNYTNPYGPVKQACGT